jgi:hypothetical protein
MNAAQIIERAREAITEAKHPTLAGIMTSQAHGAVGALHDLGLLTLEQWENEIHHINALHSERLAALEGAMR